MNNLADVAAALKRAESVLVCGHVMPDGDSLGSVLALGLTLESMGKKVIMAGPDPSPAIYDFLPGLDQYRVGLPPDGGFDTLVVLDCSVPERLGPGFQELLSGETDIIILDHHAASSCFGKYRYVDPAAAAVGEIIYDLIIEMGLDINLDVAICLYTAIVTDTGSFQYDSTTPGTLRRVANLMEIGVPAALINVRIYEEKPKVFFQLLCSALSTLTTSSCGKISWMTVTRETIKNSGAKDEHTEGLVNYAKSIRGVEVGILFREIGEGSYKISFRSKDAIDVNRLAALFGGGGHPHASGCTVQGDLNEIIDRVVSAALLAARGIVR
ncbi:MAG: bifunctional oligoribonuclease/PAP phosphatase NrnA [Desulfotomaculaceae bacterium]|nr:bifunctional oligoribonuclease/PAP phosphatase NrnA [Desulfotomaculaceae bacterium]